MYPQEVNPVGLVIQVNEITFGITHIVRGYLTAINPIYANGLNMGVFGTYGKLPLEGLGKTLISGVSVTAATDSFEVSVERLYCTR